MNGITPYNNKVNFTAKLDVSSMTTNVKRWKNIAGIFEKKTADAPNDTFVLMKDDNGSVDICHMLQNSGISYCKLAKNKVTALLKNSDDKIADSMAKLLGIYKHTNKNIEYARDLLNKMEKNDKAFDSEFAGEFWKLIFNKCVKDVQKSIAKSPDLKIFSAETTK